MKQRAYPLRTILKTHLSVVIRDDSVKTSTMLPPTGVMGGPGRRKHSLLGRCSSRTSGLLVLLLTYTPGGAPLMERLPLLLLSPLRGLNPLQKVAAIVGPVTPPEFLLFLQAHSLQGAKLCLHARRLFIRMRPKQCSAGKGEVHNLELSFRFQPRESEPGRATGTHIMAVSMSSKIRRVRNRCDDLIQHQHALLENLLEILSVFPWQFVRKPLQEFPERSVRTTE